MAVNISIFSETGDIPKYATMGAAGVDVKSKIDIEIPPFKTVLVPTGIYVEIPIGYELQVRPRSGLALKHSITLMNSPGTIDSDYRGECNIIMYNGDPTNTFKISVGDRIAQFVCSKVEDIIFIPAQSKEELSETFRGEGGFGHTGLN